METEKCMCNFNGKSIIVLPTVLPTSLSLGEDKQPERTLGTRLKCNIIVINIITVIVIVSILINNYSLLLMLLLLITLRIFFPSVRNNLILRMRFSWGRAFAIRQTVPLATRPSKKCRQICGHSQRTAIQKTKMQQTKPTSPRTHFRKACMLLHKLVESLHIYFLLIYNFAVSFCADRKYLLAIGHCSQRRFGFVCSKSGRNNCTLRCIILERCYCQCLSYKVFCVLVSHCQEP